MTEVKSVTIDRPYTEPSHAEDFLSRLAVLFGNTEMSAENKPIADLLMDAFKRIIDLERAMMPFGVQASMMANAMMNLAASDPKRAKEPAGGTWISTVSNIRMNDNAAIFYNLTDVLGRELVQKHVENIFKKVEADAKLKAEKDSHVEAGATFVAGRGHLGGGKVQ